MTEQAYQSKLIKRYESEGYYVLKLIRTNKVGFPDLLCLKQGHSPLFIEVKANKGVLSEIQKFRIKELNDKGFTAYCLQDGKGVVYPF